MYTRCDMKKFSTREGKTISLVEVLDEAVVRAQKIIEEKNPITKKKRKLISTHKQKEEKKDEKGDFR